MLIVLVMLGNPQTYILDNIRNLLLFNNTDILVITEKKFEDIFIKVKVNVKIIMIEEEFENLMENYKNLLNKEEYSFRNGFWLLTSYRFIVLNEYMKKYNAEHIIHIENDVLVYKKLMPELFHTNEKILLTMDSKNRCIPGFMYIPNHKLLEKCLKNFEPKLNDMQNWAICYNKLNIIDTLPLFIHKNDTPVLEMITRNFSKYNAIFDGAAIGQYLGGIDPRNNSGYTVGFVNETCVIDYSQYVFVWRKNEDNISVPFIKINNMEYPIMNLHIHSKQLNKWINY